MDSSAKAKFLRRERRPLIFVECSSIASHVIDSHDMIFRLARAKKNVVSRGKYMSV